jgi:hypothetical protein
VVLIQERELLSRSSAKIFEEVLLSLRSEMDEHRQVINDNTNEIQTNFEFLCELDKKIDLLCDRMDEIARVVKGDKCEKRFQVTPLNQQEKQIFSTVFNMTETAPQVSYAQIANKLGMGAHVVASYATRLAEKGVPVVKKIHGGKVFLSFPGEFRQIQIKENIVGIDAPLSHWFT